MLALLLASPFMYIYLGVESSMYLHETFIIPTITSRTHRPIPNDIAVAVAVELPNAMECEIAVPELCKAIQNGLLYPCFNTGSRIYSSSSDLLLSFCGFANCSFQMLLALSESRLGKTRSKTSEYQLAA